MDLGRVPFARFADGDLDLSENIVTHQDLEFATAQVSDGSCFAVLISVCSWASLEEIIVQVLAERCIGLAVLKTGLGKSLACLHVSVDM